MILKYRRGQIARQRWLKQAACESATHHQLGIQTIMVKITFAAEINYLYSQTEEEKKKLCQTAVRLHPLLVKLWSHSQQQYTSVCNHVVI